MPYRSLKFEEAAEYIHVSAQELMRLINRRNIPFEQARGQYVFRQNELRDWLNQHILGDTHHAGVDEFHRQVDGKLAEQPDERTHYLTQCLQEGAVELDLRSRSPKKILAEIADLAFEAHVVTDSEEFLKQLQEREDLCSTGLAGGVAIPHPRLHSPYLMPENALLVARSSCGVPYGAADHKKTDIFLIPCGSDDRSHLFLLSRIALMLQKTELADRLREAQCYEDVFEAFDEEEQELIRILSK